MKNYDTVTEAVQDLKVRGYTINFNLAFDKLICSENKVCLQPEDFEIVEVHRFEGETNPSDEDVVYAVESKDARPDDPVGRGKHKGIITSAFGLYADPVSNVMIQKLRMKPH